MHCRLTAASVCFLIYCIPYLGDLVKLTGSQFRQIWDGSKVSPAKALPAQPVSMLLWVSRGQSLLFRQENERWGWDVLCMWMQGRQASALTSQVPFTGQHTGLSSLLTNIDWTTAGNRADSRVALQRTLFNVFVILTFCQICNKVIHKSSVHMTRNST